MIVSKLVLKNWRNFRDVEVRMGNRVFVIGPNASGKSNFLDVFRFLRDIVKPGGGLQKAIIDRGGLSKIRCLAARRDPDIGITVHFSEGSGDSDSWRYAMSVKQEPRGRRQAIVAYERVWKNDKLILNRPDEEDERDPERKSQTHLEQINANSSFREIHRFLGSISYLHIVPQLLRNPDAFAAYKVADDPFGGFLIEHIAEVTKRTRDARLRKIQDALRLAVPQFRQLTQVKDERGVPHLEAIYEHWREHGARQREDQFSDGTLRLIGLLWSLLESDTLLLLEEPELSLHSELVSRIPGLMHRLQTKKRRQVMVSTHSADLLRDPGIGGEEVLLLTPGAEGTSVRVTSDYEEVKQLLESGMTIADAALPRTAPGDAAQLSFFE